MMRFATGAAAALALTAGSALARQADVPQPVMDLHRADILCEAPEDLPNGDDIRRYDMGDDYILYFIPCISGAYNFSYRIYLDMGTLVIRQMFAEFSDYMGWYGTDTIFLGDFDAATGVLHSFYKGRGVGDCGSTGTWQWDGAQFVLVEYRHKGECDGSDSEWPVLFAHPNLPAWPIPTDEPTLAGKDKIAQ